MEESGGVVLGRGGEWGRVVLGEEESGGVVLGEEESGRVGVEGGDKVWEWCCRRMEKSGAREGGGG